MFEAMTAPPGMASTIRIVLDEQGCLGSRIGPDNAGRSTARQALGIGMTLTCGRLPRRSRHRSKCHLSARQPRSRSEEHNSDEGPFRGRGDFANGPLDARVCCTDR